MPSNKFLLLALAVAAAKEAPTAAKALDSKELAGKPLLEKVQTSLAAVKPTAQFQPAKEILGAVKPTLSMMGDIEGKVGAKMRVEYKARDGKAAEMTWLAVSKAFVKMAGVDPSRVTVALTVGGGIAGEGARRRSRTSRGRAFTARCTCAMPCRRASRPSTDRTSRRQPRSMRSPRSNSLGVRPEAPDLRASTR